MAKVFVGIVTYNSLYDLPDCIACLRRQTYPAVDIVAFDNASADGTIAWLKSEASDIDLIVSDTNLGFGAGHNRIISKCQPEAGDYYLPLNPDVTLEPGYIEALVSALERRSAGWVIGKLLLPGGDDLDNSRHRIYSAGHALRRDGYAINIGYGLLDEGQFEIEREIFGASGAAPIFSQRMIADLSQDGVLFDENMFMYAEDTDLDWRARLQGWQCWYTPTAAAVHKGSAPGWQLEAMTIANRYLSVIRNAYLLDLVIYNMPLIIIHCVLRLVMTPPFGLLLTSRLFRLAARFWNKRHTPVVERAEMLAWFKWGSQQSTSQPGTFIQRLIYALS